MEKRSSFFFILLVVILAIAGGFLGGKIEDCLDNTNGKLITESAQQAEPQVEKVYVEESQIIETVKKVSPSVVSIVISKDMPLYRERIFNFNDFFNDPFNFGAPFSVPEFDRDKDGNVRK